MLDEQAQGEEGLFSAGKDQFEKENFLASQMNLDNIGLTQNDGKDYDAAMSSQDPFSYQAFNEDQSEESYQSRNFMNFF